jgi:hypothetical protein
VHKKDLQRRANHRHISIVGKISPLPEKAAGFLVPAFFDHDFWFGAVSGGLRANAVLFLRLDSSGKSPVYIHHRKN